MISYAGPRTKFRPGQLVRHKRYGYLGVVVDSDPHCRAPDSWYLRNRTQPDRQQPWYHVLVDGSDTATYAAQTSLEETEQALPIEHPLLEIFFSDFDGEAYVRNQRDWPSTWE